MVGKKRSGARVRRKDVRDVGRSPAVDAPEFRQPSGSKVPMLFRPGNPRLPMPSHFTAAYQIFAWRRFAVFCLLWPLSGCLTPERAIAEVDEEAGAVINAKATASGLSNEAANAYPSPSRRTKEIVASPLDLAPEASETTIDLISLLELGAKNSREYQDQKERVYRAALGFMREREDFAGRPSALFSSSATASNDTESLGLGGELGFSRMLERGGSYALSLGGDFLRFISSPTSENLASFLDLSIALPFFRNAGQEIVQENLTQADRDLLYALRDFERFKQEFTVDLTSQYLRILSRKQRIKNEESNLKQLQLTRERNEAMFAEGRLGIVEVDQARQQELGGRSRLIAAEQDLDRSLDDLKLRLGLPVDSRLHLSSEDLQRLPSPLDAPLSVPEVTAMKLGLHRRLDLRNAVDGVADSERRVKVAENQLEPDLLLRFSSRADSANLKPLRYNFSDGTYSATASLDPGLYRELESIALRQSWLDRERAFRDQEATADTVKAEVRDALRGLLLAQEEYRISKDAFALAEKRVASSEALLAEGRATTRDFLESQDAYLSSQNTLLDALIDYRIAALVLLRDTGVLVVGPGGFDEASSRAALVES
jgi:outer membrane protein TolC